MSEKSVIHKYLKDHRSIVFLCFICFVLIAIRCFLSQQLSYAFLFLNLLLAFIPYFISGFIKADGSKWKYRILFLSWLLFFPNAPYIITDMLHLRPKANIPFWYDTLMMYTFAFSGMMLGFMSLQKVEYVLEKRYGKIISMLSLILIFILTGFGIYLGRFERWNSWDVLMNPFSLCRDILFLLLKSFEHPAPLVITFVFALVLFALYLPLKNNFKNEVSE